MSKAEAKRNILGKKKIMLVLGTLEKTHQPTMLESLGAEGFTSFQLLVATVLSARSKDSTTIPIVRKLFAAYPTPEQILNLMPQMLQQFIYGVGFYKVKAAHLQELSKILIERFDARVPDTLEELTSLPGVGRKTANCMLSYAFGKNAIAVDTHVHRIANRLGWAKTKTPEQSEMALQKVVPQQHWSDINRLLVGHGQRICVPITPRCAMCPVRQWCAMGLRTMSI